MDNLQNFDTNQPTPQEQMLPQKTSIGAFIGIIIVIIIIILGGMYFWGKRIELQQKMSGEKDSATEILKNQSASDELTDIEADANATDLNNLDTELNTIDTDLKASGL